MNKPILSILAMALSLTACAGTGADYEPILDGRPGSHYRTDLAACQTLAYNQRQYDQDTLGAAVLGAGAGAVLGELDDGDGDVGALGGAIAGALVGGVVASGEADEKRKAIIIACMKGRGQRVVG